MVSISPTSVSPGDTVTVTWSVVDETGVGDALGDNRFSFSHEDIGVGEVFGSLLVGATLISGDATNGTYQSTATVPDTVGGTYEISVFAEDQLGNGSFNNFSETLTVNASS